MELYVGCMRDSSPLDVVWYVPRQQAWAHVSASRYTGMCMLIVALTPVFYSLL